MTWVTDGTGTRWVPVQPRKRRKPGRAVRFANLQSGDILIHRAQWQREVHVKHAVPVANDDRRTEQGTAVGFAMCEHRWFDPVKGERDETAGQMASVRIITSHGLAPHLGAHTLRGLASNGYWPASKEQGAAIREWLALRERVVAAFDAGEMTRAEARLAYKPWAVLLHECGLALDDTRPSWAGGK